MLNMNIRLTRQSAFYMNAHGADIAIAWEALPSAISSITPPYMCDLLKQRTDFYLSHGMLPYYFTDHENIRKVVQNCAQLL